MTIVGYATCESVRLGERLGFCISVDNHGAFQFDVVRLIHGDDNPAGPGRKEEVVDHPANGVYDGHFQPIHPGSCAIVTDTPALAALGSFTAAAFVCPTLPGGSRQSIIGKLAVDTIADGAHAGRAGPLGVRARRWYPARCSSSTSRQARCWYSIAAGFDVHSSMAWLSIDPEVTPTNSRLRVVAHEGQMVRREWSASARSPRLAFR